MCNQSIEPHPMMLPNFFVCGETFSTHQGWLEGALETSEMVLKAISMGVPILVSRSGFTKSAVHLARKFNLSMIGRFKGKRFMCVSGFERILL